MVYLVSIFLIAVFLAYYLKGANKKARQVSEKIASAKESGTYEPVHIHPKIDYNICMGSGACVKACPEKDILAKVHGKGKTIHASNCIGHGACAAACPVGAITLVFGTEKRGVEIPYVSPEFETNVSGVYIAGELGGMGLIRNAITQGVEALEYIEKSIKLEGGGGTEKGVYDLVCVGAGPAGIGATLAAKKAGLKCYTFDQGDIGGTVFNFPRNKIVMTAPVNLPIYGKVKLNETTKEALLALWNDVIEQTKLEFSSGEKMTGLENIGSGEKNLFKVTTSKGEYKAKRVLLAIGRRGTPRKLGVQGEERPTVTYRLLDAEQHKGESVLVVGGGDSAVEAAIAISEEKLGNTVTLSYRRDTFSRIKPMNRTRFEEAVEAGRVEFLGGSNVKEIKAGEVDIAVGDEERTIPNDYVYIFAGGELPNQFLKNIGIRVDEKFGEA